MAKTIKNRRQAQEGHSRYDPLAPKVGDVASDRVTSAYAAWPDRLYLIGLDGRVVYASGIGPLGFKPAELKQAIDEY